MVYYRFRVRMRVKVRVRVSVSNSRIVQRLELGLGLELWFIIGLELGYGLRFGLGLVRRNNFVLDDMDSRRNGISPHGNNYNKPFQKEI